MGAERATRVCDDDDGGVCRVCVCVYVWRAVRCGAVALDVSGRVDNFRVNGWRMRMRGGLSSAVAEKWLCTSSGPKAVCVRTTTSRSGVRATVRWCVYTALACVLCCARARQ